MRILWLENHAVFVRMAARQCLADHDLTVVASIAAARDALMAQDFDAVLADYDLDDGKGTEVVQILQQLPDRPVVIATSSHADGNAALLAAGADAACPKTRFTELESIMQTAFSQRRKD